MENNWKMRKDPPWSNDIVDAEKQSASDDKDEGAPALVPDDQCQDEGAPALVPDDQCQDEGAPELAPDDAQVVQVSEVVANKDLAHSLAKLKSRAEVADVIFVTKDTEIPAHRCVLTATSVYFSTMFTSEFAERNLEKIPMPAIDGATLELLLEFLYTGEIQITEENVQDLLLGASMLQLDEVREQCARFLGRSLRPSNVLGICDFAEFQDCKKLMEDSEQFISTYFSDVVQSEEFLIAKPERVSKMLASNVLMVEKEEQVLDALLKWVKFKLVDRLPYLSKFLDHVRLELIPKGRLFSYLLTDEILVDDPNCKKRITSVTNLTTAEKKKLRPRKPLFKPAQEIYVFSGSTLTSNVKVFDFLKQDWSLLPPMNVKRTRAQLALINEELYVLGGIRGGSLKTVRVFDFINQRWRAEKPMRTSRSNFASCILMDKVFVCGGMRNDTVLSSSEMFSIKDSLWNPLAKMQTGRAYHAAAVIDDSVYAVGGCSNGHLLDSVERYSSVLRKWSSVRPMKTRRSGPTAGVIDGLLYVAGGWDGVYHRSCEVYDPVTNDWKFVSPMIKARRNAGCVVCNGRLFVIGGDDEGGICHKTVEFYDPRCDRWCLHPYTMLHSGKYTSAAVTATA